MNTYLKPICATLLALSVTAHAAVVITIEEIDGNVVVNGSGSISTTNGLTTDNIVQSGANQHFVRPATATILTTRTLIPNWTGANTPSDFSTSTQAMRAATSFSGSDFGVTRVGIALSREYVFGDPIVFSMTFANQTLDSLAMRSGTYDWSWGSADDGDSVRLCVGDLATCSKQEPEPPAPTAATPVPTVGAFGLMGLASAIGAAGIAMNRRRKQ